MKTLHPKRIAVLGGGIQGASVALSLAERGHSVDLFERESEALSCASLWNEGKIHLGFLYANDDIESTGARMLDGAQSFSSILSRYVDGALFEKNISKAFTYAVHRKSLLDAAHVENHFARISAEIKKRNFCKWDYFGVGDPHEYRCLSKAEIETSYDGGEVVAAFETKEISIDTFVVAEQLRRVLALHDRVHFYGACNVKSLHLQEDGRYRVNVCKAEGESPVPDDGYDVIVNALWSDRLRVDAEMGMAPSRPFRFRYKLAVHGRGITFPDSVRSTTIVLGEFGDIVVFPNGRLYLSWYPSCLIGESAEIEPPNWELEIASVNPGRILSEVVSELSTIAPGLDRAGLADAKIDVKGGVIFSWGEARIGDLQDEVHRRTDIGVASRGNYHTINTGKYGMAPHFGEEVAKKISGA